MRLAEHRRKRRILAQIASMHLEAKVPEVVTLFTDQRRGERRVSDRRVADRRRVQVAA